MSERTQRMKAKMNLEAKPVSVERLRIMMETAKNYGQMPFITREARFMETMFDKFPIWIKDDELIVGAGAAKPDTVEAFFGYGVWDSSEIALYKQDGYPFTPEDEAFIYNVIEESKPIGVQDVIDLVSDDRLDDVLETGYLAPPWPRHKKGTPYGSPRGAAGNCATGLGPEPPLGFFCFDYDRIMKLGFKGILAEVKKARDKHYFGGEDCFKAALKLDAMKMDLEAFIRYVGRYAVLARELAEKESSEQRKKELLQIADTCEWIPANPPRGFRDAIQLAFFLMLLQIPNSTMAMGRMDQYLYPFYKKDIEAGKITDDEVIELFECLRIKLMEQELVNWYRKLDTKNKIQMTAANCRCIGVR